jgi:hypothetical protein
MRREVIIMKKKTAFNLIKTLALMVLMTVVFCSIWYVSPVGLRWIKQNCTIIETEYVEVEVEKPIEVIKEVIKEVEVEKVVEVIKEVEVEKIVEVEKEVIKEIEVEKIVEVEKEVIKEVIIEKPIEIIKEIIVEKNGNSVDQIAIEECPIVQLIDNYGVPDVGMTSYCPWIFTPNVIDVNAGGMSMRPLKLKNITNLDILTNFKNFYKDDARAINANLQDATSICIFINFKKSIIDGGFYSTWDKMTLSNNGFIIQGECKIIDMVFWKSGSDVIVVYGIDFNTENIIPYQN